MKPSEPRDDADAATRENLWRDRDFMRYWLGESMSRFGVQVTALAVPLLAVVELDATPAEAGLLNGVQFAPYLLITLLAGVWVDRVRPRLFLILTNFARAALLTLLPLLYFLDVLDMVTLCVVGFAIGVLAVLYDLSSSTYLPSLLDKDQLAAGNSRIQGSISVARIGGPGFGGLLVQFLSISATLIANAAIHLFSAIVLLTVRERQDLKPAADPGTRDRKILAEIATSLRFVAANPYLRVLAFRAGFNNLFFMAMQTMLPLFIIRDLGKDSGTVGLVLATGAVGSLVGATLAVRFGNRFGPGPAIVIGFGAGSFAQAIIPLASGPTVLVMGILLGSFLLGGIGTTIGNVHLATLTQTVTPREILGRINSVIRFLTWGTMPVGALLGGWLGSVIGIRATLAVTAVGFVVSLLLVLFSPIATLKELPEEAPMWKSPA
jgi:MFS family permease